MPKPYIVKDEYTKRARIEGFRARSVFKLKELDEKYGLFAPGLKVLDLGAAPGSWLQYISAKIEPDGKVLGLDLAPIKPISKNVKTYECDITKPDEVEGYLKKEELGKVDIIVSDLAPATTGIKYTDQQRSLELDQAVLKIAQKHLNPGGALVMKIFQGPKMDQFIKNLKSQFKFVQTTTVSASRDRSKEMYIICY